MCGGEREERSSSSSSRRLVSRRSPSLFSRCVLDIFVLIFFFLPRHKGGCLAQLLLASVSLGQKKKPNLGLIRKRPETILSEQPGRGGEERRGEKRKRRRDINTNSGGPFPPPPFPPVNTFLYKEHKLTSILSSSNGVFGQQQNRGSAHR